MKIITIVGARPQFIKAATVSRQLMNNDLINEIIVHTGQHYDKNMSEIFFEELKISKPNYNLEVGSGSHGVQTAMMLTRIEEVLLKEKPSKVLVYGDTNSTIAGALAAVKLSIPVSHVEAGLRSFNRDMPEEINRIGTDHFSNVLFTPTPTAMENLKNEGLDHRAIFSGDVMYDSIIFYKKIVSNNLNIFHVSDLPTKYYLATIHRPANTDNKEKLKGILTAFSKLNLPVVLPVHPRTRKIIAEQFDKFSNIILIDPVGYLQMISLLLKSEKVLTDSGGLQKEAYFLQKQCITLRKETEWMETLHDNWNTLVGANVKKIINAVKTNITNIEQKNNFGEGNAANIIAEHLAKT